MDLKQLAEHILKEGKFVSFGLYMRAVHRVVDEQHLSLFDESVLAGIAADVWRAFMEKGYAVL